MESNYIAPTGPLLDELEQAVAERTGFNHALALQSGTAALHLGIRHLIDTRHPANFPFPPLILASSLSFIASISPALQMGCEVRLIDAEEDSWTLDPVLLSHALAEARAEERPVLAVLPTDLYGQRCDMQAIQGLCAPQGIPVLCDAAEALGAVRTLPETPAPWAEVYSLNGNKIITASAGGLLVSDDKDFIEHARKLSQQAREPVAHYEHRELGYNYRMSHLLAAVALAQFDVLDDRITKRRALFEGYRERLAGLPGIRFMPEAPWNTATRWLSILRLDALECPCTPEELRLHLESHNIESRLVWKPLHQQPVLRHLRMYTQGVSDRLYAEGLCLPSGSALTPADLDRICGLIREMTAV
ncbi:MAG: DegT/DnrJ/EryC1/StrS family aminotransferase [Verrucomicrobia bacterium]|nr:DegT/DnrJ/EryC1/StrS family aminotransferase [Verrucomicrobiota bacterium]